LEAALEAIGQTSPHWSTRSDQEYTLSLVSTDFSSRFVTICLAAGRPEEAARYYAASQGILIAEGFHHSNAVDQLQQSAPDLVDEYLALQREAETASRQRLGDAGGSSRRSRSEAAREALKTFVQEARRTRVPDFMSPPAPEFAKISAPEAPIVIVAVTDSDSTALVMRGPRVDSITLGFSRSDLDDRARELVAATSQRQAGSHRQPESATRILHDTLQWLWEALVGPVVDELTGTGRPIPSFIRWAVPPRMSVLPIHAALNSATGESLLDLTASVIVSDLKRLEPPATEQSLDGEMLAIAMPHTPGLADLPEAASEVKAVAEVWASTTIFAADGGRRPTPPSVAQELPGARAAHIACHAVSEFRDPASSRLVLLPSEGGPSGDLVASSVAELKLSNLRFAFLSACSSGTAGMSKSVEPLHLAAAFRVAGAGAVVGTLWPVRDREALKIAEAFYEHLHEQFPRVSDMVLSDALRHACARSRARSPQEPLKWASHFLML
jgi:CHAT domain-containing protein